MNNYEGYTAQTQAQKGFKTFVFTLSISLIVFSVIYYFISESQTVTQTEGKNEKNNVQVMGSPIQQNAKEESPFSQLSETKMATAQRAVLAGATTSPTKTTTVPIETTPSVVPQTGTIEVTVGLLLSAIAFMGGLWVISKNPRKLALHAFERKMLEE